MVQSTDSLPARVAESTPKSRRKAPAGSSASKTGTRPFARFEWMIAGRYLRARRREAFISVIAGFSFIGIMLGVATLIIVMAVMNGFRAQLIDKILGLKNPPDERFRRSGLRRPLRLQDRRAEVSRQWGPEHVFFRR